MDNNNTFYNTTSLKGQPLKEATEKALTQKQIIHELFIFSPEAKTPFDVAVMLIKQGSKWPITSIRSRMNALTNEGVLVKSEDADKPGEYGMKNHCWKLANKLSE